MKWWPWSRKKEVADVPDAVDMFSADMHFLKALDVTFDRVQRAELMMDVYIHEMDTHRLKFHRSVDDCDTICGPSSVLKMIQPTSREELEMLTMVALKYWYRCYVLLRDRDQEIES